MPLTGGVVVATSPTLRGCEEVASGGAETGGLGRATASVPPGQDLTQALQASSRQRPVTHTPNWLLEFGGSQADTSPMFLGVHQDRIPTPASPWSPPGFTEQLLL